jgi:hypothetical protein
MTIHHSIYIKEYFLKQEWDNLIGDTSDTGFVSYENADKIAKWIIMLKRQQANIDAHILEDWFLHDIILTIKQDILDIHSLIELAWKVITTPCERYYSN